MPGIAAIISPRSADELQRSLHCMLRLLRHEPFHPVAAASQPLLHAAFGAVNNHERPLECVWNRSGDIGCVLFGEVTLGTATDSDVASALIDAYALKGIAALANLNGCFSGVLVDLRERQLVLFNDRFGLNRVYVAEDGEQTLFASEAKALLALLPQCRQLDPTALAEWWSCGCVLQDRTLFRGISLLPPASAWVFSSHGVQRRSYFDCSSWEAQPGLDPEAYERRLAEVFAPALERVLRADAPVAMSLTGGLDGRMIMAWASAAPGKLPCYTFNGPIRDCADARIAQQVARLCHQPHQSIAMGADFFPAFASLAEKSVYITDGAMDVSGAAELYVNRIARQIAPVRLTGNYGSEILRRHVAFRPRRFAGNPFTADFAALITSAAHTYGDESRGHSLGFIVRKQVPWHHFSRFALERSQVRVRSPFLDNELVSVAFQAPAQSAHGLEPTLRVIAAGNAALMQVPTDRGVTWPPAATALNRFRHRFHDCVAKAEYAYDYGMPDWLARADRAVSRLHLERLFLGRQKFVHFRSWYRHQLAEYVRTILLDPMTLDRPFINRESIEHLVTGHVRGTHNRTLEIHKLLSIELMHRSLLDSSLVGTSSERVSADLVHDCAA